MNRSVYLLFCLITLLIIGGCNDEPTQPHSLSKKVVKIKGLQDLRLSNIALTIEDYSYSNTPNNSYSTRDTSVFLYSHFLKLNPSKTDTLQNPGLTDSISKRYGFYWSNFIQSGFAYTDTLFVNLGNQSLLNFSFHSRLFFNSTSQNFNLYLHEVPYIISEDTLILRLSGINLQNSIKYINYKSSYFVHTGKNTGRGAQTTTLAMAPFTHSTSLEAKFIIE